MRSLIRSLRCGWVLLAGLGVVSCGGGGGGSIASSSSGASTTTVTSGANVLPVIVDGGPNNKSANTLFASVTICVPGSTTQCQTIDHVQVDTGSYGFRVLASVLTLSLPVTMASDGNSLVECTKFVDGYSWGPVASADLQVGGESASAVPVQVIGSSSFATVPAGCSSAGPAEDTVAQFGANGILGVGVFEQDCGSGCVIPGSGVYYSCTQTACNDIGVPLTSQVLNVIPLFAADNNGSIIVLPMVAAAGATTLSGSLIFGIDTESNNASGSETVLTLDGGGDFTTTFNSAPLNTSFIDSGSNGLFFDDSSITACTNPNFKGFYCPASTLSFTATLTGAGTAPATTTATFSVADAESLNGAFTVLPELGGEFTTSGTSMTSATTTFDWGLPFFYGRRVANALENHHTLLASGPYVAF